MIRSITLSFIFLISSFSVSAQELRLPRIFNDHMVLQRDSNVRIWGWSESGSEVSVSIGETEVYTLSDESGYWEAYLPEMAAGGPYTLSVTSGQTVTYEDVYIGDVWIAGGQSNMEWTIGSNINNMEAELNDSDYPMIRFFKVPRRLSVTPLIDLEGGEWKVSNSENAQNFSAVAWFFAKQNHIEKGVPVGIIDNNWGGTPAESWAPLESLLDIDDYQEEARDLLDHSQKWINEIEENDLKNTEKYTRVNDTEDFKRYGAHLPDFNDSEWETTSLPNNIPMTDFVYLRKSFQLASVSDAVLSFGNPGKFTVAFINGISVFEKSWNDDPEYISIDKEVLREGDNIIVIRTSEDWNNRVFIGSENDFWLRTEEQEITLTGDWKYSNTVEPPMPVVTRYFQTPGVLYNGMIRPVEGYTMNGAIWYQGESNAGSHHVYNELFETMIEEWRSKWNQGSFPFLFVQLANFMNREEQPTDPAWAYLREAQTQTLSLANTGMAVTIDIGEANDIHPRNKQDVGYRLWQSARKVAFAENVVHSGPMYRGHVINGSKVEVSFDHTGSGLTNISSGPLAGFSIAGNDGVFHWAEARIEGSKVIVENDKVPNPVSVRYAWANNPTATLYNKEGLPAIPFRTDTW